MSGSQAGEDRTLDGERSLTLRMEGFALEAIEQESARLGVAVEELAAFALQYYLADLDSGRIARRFPRGLYSEGSPSDGSS